MSNKSTRKKFPWARLPLEIREHILELAVRDVLEQPADIKNELALHSLELVFRHEIARPCKMAISMVLAQLEGLRKQQEEDENNVELVALAYLGGWTPEQSRRRLQWPDAEKSFMYLDELKDEFYPDKLISKCKELKTQRGRLEIHLKTLEQTLLRIEP